MDDTTIGGWAAWYRPGFNGTIMDAFANEKAPSQRLRGALRDYLGSILAEREGFEPSVGLRLRLISSQVHSTTLPPFLGCFVVIAKSL